MKLIQIDDNHFVNPDSLCSITSYGDNEGVYVTYKSGGKNYYEIEIDELINMLESNGVQVARLRKVDEPVVEQIPKETRGESTDGTV